MTLPGAALIVLTTLLGGCFGALTDSATRLAYDIESAVRANSGKDHFAIRHTPSRATECSGRYTVQLDKVGALIVWCYDATDAVTASGSTSYHARFIDTPRTWIVEKPAGSTLVIEVRREGGRVTVTEVR